MWKLCRGTLVDNVSTWSSPYKQHILDNFKASYAECICLPSAQSSVVQCWLMLETAEKRNDGKE
jgi:hypothetical protein